MVLDNRIQRLVKDDNLSELSVGTLPVYESCLEGKIMKMPFSTKRQRATKPI